jgi:di/tricarboxylate transporter
MGSPPRKVRKWDYIPLALFLAIILWVAIGGVDMVQAAMVAAAILVMVGWIDSKTAVSYVDWDLLLLIGSMLGFSRAMVTSGLANMIGTGIKESGISPLGSLFLIYGVTTLITEIMTNNAAAGLLFPLAVATAKKLDISYKPFMFIVMGAASTSFLTPIGYQTNVSCPFTASHAQLLGFFLCSAKRFPQGDVRDGVHYHSELTHRML